MYSSNKLYLHMDFFLLLSVCELFIFFIFIYLFVYFSLQGISEFFNTHNLVCENYKFFTHGGMIFLFVTSIVFAVVGWDCNMVL